MPTTSVNASDIEGLVVSPDNMLDVNVVDQDGNKVDGINMALVDENGNEVATWKSGSNFSTAPNGSYIRALDSNSEYDLFTWKLFEIASDYVGGANIRRITRKDNGREYWAGLNPMALS